MYEETKGHITFTAALLNKTEIHIPHVRDRTEDFFELPDSRMKTADAIEAEIQSHYAYSDRQSRQSHHLNELDYVKMDHIQEKGEYTPGKRNANSISQFSNYQTQGDQKTKKTEDLTSFDSASRYSDNGTDGWYSIHNNRNQYSKKTLALMNQKQKRLKKLEHIAENREMKKDPVRRLEAFKEHIQDIPTKFADVKIHECKPAKLPAVFEWDIHPGEVTMKFLVTQ